jgi:tetratricopeptide (TPR) repeat protein
VKRLAALVVLAATAATAAAQSTRYPPEPIDADKEAEEHSDFWERALEPDRGRYDVVLARARRLIDARTPKDLADAATVLGEAITLLPNAPDAYFLRGWAHELAAQWAACADDYVAAADRDPSFVPAPNPRTRGGLADAQGVCLARAGRFDEAETILSQVTAAGGADAGVWMRLGEVDMALGRLDDAIAALDAALKVARAPEIPAIRWLRAMALDRARKPAAAIDEAAAAKDADPTLGRLINPALPSAPAEDYYYAVGIGYSAKGSPERALLYFREFVKQAPKSQWRKRADEHVATLAAIDPTDALGRAGARQGTSTIQTAAIAKAWRKDLAALARCLKDTPEVVAEVRVVIHGPPAPPAKRGAPVVLLPKPPAAGAKAKSVGQLGATAGDPVAAVKCVETAAGKLKLPRLEKGTWVQLQFPVIYR